MPAAGPEPLLFDAVARVPAPGDNAAIALRTLPAGSRILIRQLVFELAETVLEGHRFAIYRIRKGAPLLSWGLPFGLATRDIEPGEYLCNEKILRGLAGREIDAILPKSPNFTDYRLAFHLDEANFKPAQQMNANPAGAAFLGYPRNARRGAGTRNSIVVLGTSSRTGAFVRSVAAEFRSISQFPNIDRVVPVDHTEGGSSNNSRNFDLTLRTLAGFIVNPNVAAVLCVDFPGDRLNNAALRDYLAKNNYPLEDLLLEFLSIRSYEASRQHAIAKIEGWLSRANSFAREPLPLRFLKIGLQCGGSDAFSGISANPLVGLLARDAVALGGSANLAETDELIGAEPYVLDKVRDLETARAFLNAIDRFQEWAAQHGHSAEGNPSGGNLLRGLYNITLKSIGAARKKDPATRLDYVIDFAEPMSNPGFYFMNSPGNDLESMAGQAAAGCNIILFATGNGSITNFPFVPAIKLMTTTRRFELVRHEMDFNAGRFLEGEPLEGLGKEAFAQMLRIASGERSAGERAGHSQVQLWREWRGGKEAEAAPAPVKTTRPHATGLAIPAELRNPCPPPRAALVLPTSLCSGQIASRIAAQMNLAPGQELERAVALPHTEGCGNSAGEAEQLFLRTMAGYLAHPSVARGVLLEHGCEKTHNDAFRHILRELGINPARYGFASIQLDGGIDQVIQKVLRLFRDLPSRAPEERPFAMAFAAEKPCDYERALVSELAASLTREKMIAVLSESFAFSQDRIDYGERVLQPGCSVMRSPTTDLTEMISGLAATGVELIAGFSSDGLIPGNPLVPVIQAAEVSALPEGLRGDVDIPYSASEPIRSVAERILERAAAVRTGAKRPRNAELNNYAFQITRGLSGISL